MNLYRSTSAIVLLSGLLSFSPLANSEDKDTQQLVDVIYAGRKFVALRTEAEEISVELEPHEKALWSRGSGGLGVVLTSHRFMVATTTSATWLEKPLGIAGFVEPKAYLSTDLVFIRTEGKILGYDGITEKFLEWKPADGEHVLAVIVENGAGALALEQQAVGYAGGSDRFVSIPFQPNEAFSSTAVESGTLTIRTSMRKLTFDKHSTRWSEAPLPPSTPR